MNVKKTAISFTSSALSAVAIVGAVAMMPAQAKAGDVESVLIALGTAIVFNEIYKDRTDKVGRVENVYGSQHNPLNERQRPGYAAGLNDANKVCYQEVIRHGNYAEVVESNCYGVVVNTKIIRR
jgi:hypothetical protein